MDATAFLDEMLEPLETTLTAESATALASLRASAAAQRRIDELAELCNEGRLTEDQREEYRAIVAAATMLAILQAKARAYLARHAA